MTVTVRYFALFREQRGLSDERLDLEPCTAQDLYARLAELHGFSLDPAFVRAAINQAFEPMETALSDGDEIVFVPPVAGG